ncbi:hypothetical protein C4K39_6279 [Pseudomonas sessilinigenes]|nr:hypothetical protein C4K39_6279 [Pseudomonas sessilinigenes]
MAIRQAARPRSRATSRREKRQGWRQAPKRAGGTVQRYFMEASYVLIIRRAGSQDRATTHSMSLEPTLKHLRKEPTARG